MFNLAGESVLGLDMAKELTQELEDFTAQVNGDFASPYPTQEDFDRLL